uniref:Glutaminyl-peptide cyclotransferase n=1 Tax=Rhabditophanes sp. KR3021 TaxID=114890 RepID=A0AC35UAH9_9BILA
MCIDFVELINKGFQVKHLMTPLTTSNRIRLAQSWKINDFKTLLSPILIPRTVGSNGHKKVADYITNVSKDAGFSVEYDIFDDITPNGRFTFKNIIATFDPSAPRRLVLACHYDSKIFPNQVFIGAIDSAVPCAMMLDIANVLGPLLSSRKDKSITLQLIFFDGEEAFKEWTSTDSIYGSRHLAHKWATQYYNDTDGKSQNLVKEIDRIDVLVLLDLLGAPGTTLNPFYSHKTYNHYSKFSDIELALRNTDNLYTQSPVFSTSYSYGAIEDDHVPFLARKVPIVHLIPSAFPREWHTINDDATILDYTSIHTILTVVKIFTGKPWARNIC